MTKLSYKTGYSIIETIIYIALFTILSVLVINSFITVLSTFSVSRVNRNMLDSGLGAMERMSREIRQAKSVDVGNSTFAADPGALTLSTTDSNGNARTVKFISENHTVNLYENGSLLGPLSSANISVTNLVFRHIVTTKSEAVKIEMTLGDATGNSEKNENFYDTVILRGGYK